MKAETEREESMAPLSFLQNCKANDKSVRGLVGPDSVRGEERPNNDAVSGLG